MATMGRTTWLAGSIGAVLDGFPGFFHILAEAMGGATTQSNKTEESGKQDSHHEALK